MQRKSGFTIIELLVAVIIIGLLTSAAVTNYLTAQRNARDNARKASVNGLANAIEVYYAAKHSFPGFISANKGDDGESALGDSYNNTYGNSCQSLDMQHGKTYVYSYVPRPTSAFDLPFCNDTTQYPPNVYTVKGALLYDPSKYSPPPTWIPGIGEFMNPMPVEKKFLYRDGSTPTTNQHPVIGDDLTALNSTDLGTNQTRTFQYRKLKGGYAVYARLENDSLDKDATGGLQSGEPRLPEAYMNPNTSSPSPSPSPDPSLGITGTNVYLVRR
jgi:prepilin-type N-terminal cleavage/methylation domain-containing protein